MNDDLKIIKKLYGEKMMHLCRRLFVTILDTSPGFLSKVMTSKFAPNRYLYDDIMYYQQELREYILWNYYQENIPALESSDVLDPVTLLKQVGYTLYECKTYEDIQQFKKYYTPEEELCTFTYGNRLRSCYVYFAIKEGAEKLKRSDFTSPNRQDEYGTSVLSIQFSRDDSHSLSIKNRYNHTVSNPDATFSNNLDNIVPGLTQSFAAYYGMQQLYSTNNSLDIKGYIYAEGKYYKYNHEINNVYYCPNNIIIDNYHVIKYSKEKYLVIDYFIIDLVNKKIISPVEDSFSKMFNNIKKITIIKEGKEKVITVINETGNPIIMKIDKYNRIISLTNPNLTEIGDNFLRFNIALTELSLENVEKIGHKFLISNSFMRNITLPNCLSIGDDFMFATGIDIINLPKLKTIGNCFCKNSPYLKELFIPNVIHIEDDFLAFNRSIEEITIPNVKVIGDNFMCYVTSLKKVFLPNVLIIGRYFCNGYPKLDEVSIPKATEIGDHFTQNINSLNNQSLETYNSHSNIIKLRKK